jgi:hypothetical protein
MPPEGLFQLSGDRFYAPVSFILFQTFSSIIIEIERRCQHETSHCDGCAEGGAACCRGLTAHGKRTGVCAAVRHPPLHSYEALAADPEIIRCPVDINGFEYEIREASRCVKLGRTGSNRYTPQDSLALTRLMYDTRMSWGMKFAGEV